MRILISRVWLHVENVRHRVYDRDLAAESPGDGCHGALGWPSWRSLLRARCGGHRSDRTWAFPRFLVKCLFRWRFGVGDLSDPGGLMVADPPDKEFSVVSHGEFAPGR